MMNKKRGDNIELLFDTHRIEWSTYESARKALSLDVTLKPNKSGLTYPSVSKRTEAEIYQAVVLHILEGGLPSPSTLQRKLKIPYKQAKKALERAQHEKIKEKQQEYLNRKTITTRSEDDLYIEMMSWAKNHAKSSTIEIVQVFKISHELANKMIDKLVEDGLAERIDSFPKGPVGWTCSECGYHNLSLSTHCTDCFNQAPY